MVAGQWASAFGADSSEWLSTYGWPLLLLFMLFVICLYIWSYLNKNLERMKRIDSDYLDADVVEYLGWMTKAMMIIVLLFILAYVLALVWPEFNDMVWEPYLNTFFQVVIILLVLIFAGLIVKVLRHFSRRSRMTGKGGKPRSGSTVEFTSLLLSYVVYIAAAVVVVIFLLAFFADVDAVEWLRDFWNNENNAARIEALIIFLVAVILVTRLSNAVFEDYKFRTKKFNPQVIDLFKSLVRNALYLIAILVSIFMLFAIMGLPEVGLVLVVIIVVFICLVIALSYATVKNIIAGLAIMNADIFNVGEKIKLGKDLVCEVVEKNLIFTKVRTEDGETVNVPNSEIISENVLNYSRSVAHGIWVSFDLPSRIRHDEVEMLVRRAVTKVDGLMKEPAPEIFARDLIGSKMRYQV
ncbi:MAG: mechanosensitive ion channel family protein, partial [Methanomassiliicoccales archaeon]|nr:mechanosensitive ion channel family protein [Methanomassiliicoccales archaeon]